METKCDIEFENNPNKVVYAGQMLRGTVKLKFTEPKMVRAIYIQIEGKANCNLKEAILQYIGQEVYLNETTRFIDGYGGNAPNAFIITFGISISSFKLAYHK